MKKRRQRAGDLGGESETQSKRTRGKKAKAVDRDETPVEEAKSRLTERLSLGLTLVVVSAFAIFAGYLVGQYASGWTTGPSGPETSSSPSTTAPATSTRTPSQAPSSSTTTSSQGQASNAASSAPSTSTPSSSNNTTASLSVTASPSSGSQTGSNAASSTGSVLYRVQVGSFADRDQAVRQVEALKAATPPIADAFVAFDDAHKVYRVQVGSFSSQARADEFAANMTARGYEAIVAR